MTQRSIVFWNVARLFGSGGSPIEHALTLDDDRAGATASQVDRKVEVIAATIDQIARQAGPPLLVGLVEIESSELAMAIARRITTAELVDVDSVADDQTALALDGLNISLLLDRAYFDGDVVLRSHLINRAFGTRDILEADLGRRDSDHAFAVLVNHWPSRMTWEGAALRTAAAHYLARLVEAKVRFTLREMWDPEHRKMKVPVTAEVEARADTPVVVMGDFNDEVFDDSLSILGASPDRGPVVDDLELQGRSDKERYRTYRDSDVRLLNPFWSIVGKEGSYYRSPRWRTYDQILFGRGMVAGRRRAPASYVEGSAQVHNAERITLPDGTEFRITNRGGKPIDYERDGDRGCSDHFPVFASVDV